MKPFAQLTLSGQRGRIRKLAIDALARYGLPADCPLTMVNHSENVTYRVDPPGGAPRFLRVHRTHYHTRRTIESELAWAKAVRDDTGIVTPEAIPGIDGALVQRVDHPGVDQARHVVLFKRVEGRRPSESAMLGSFRRLGAVAARFHLQSMAWRRPAGFERLSWDFEGSFGPNPHWGPYRDAPGLSAADLDLLAAAVELIRTRLEAYGTAPDRYGLIHADIRLDNLLLLGDEIRVIDFDDCGFSWYLYDYACAVTIFESRPDLAELSRAWIEGYRTVRALSADEIVIIPTLVMVRRIIACGWIVSRQGTELARLLGAPFSKLTVRLAREYLDGDFVADLR